MAVLALGLLASSTVPAAAGDDPFEDSRQAVARLRFTATVSVQWVDGFGPHAVVVTVTSDRGQFRVDGPGDESLLWSTGTALLEPPAATSKYEVRTFEAGVVAGRETRATEIRSAGVLRERVVVDRELGLLLRREQLDALGRVLRVVHVESLALLPADDGSAAPAPAPRAGQMHLVTLDALPSTVRVARALAQGYQHVAAYRQGGLVQLLYSDGLHGLSLFAQPGRLDRSSLPGGGRAVQLGPWTGVLYGWPGGQAITWQAGTLVYTVVGDGPLEEIVQAAASVPGPPSPSVLSRVRARSRAVVELLRGGVA